MEFINIKGARANNLQNVNLKIPKKKITVFTGVSGSGKSSIVFETIATESARLLNETFPAFVRNFMPKYTRPDADEILNISPSIIIDQKRIGGNSRSTVGTITDIDPILRVLFSRIGKPHVGSMSCFSFNDTSGMCKTCQGIGKVMALNIQKVINSEKSLNEGAILLPGHSVGSWQYNLYANSGFFDLNKKIKDYTKEEYQKLLYAPEEKVKAEYKGNELNTTYAGLVTLWEARNIKSGREQSEKAKKSKEEFINAVHCEDCKGTRYNQEVLNCKINGYNIADITAMQADELLSILPTITNKEVILIISNLTEKIQDLVNIGLEYISLNRETGTLSGGESQRIKMVKNLASALTDMIFVFDEPSIGLHPRDVHRLNDILIKLRDKGNTVIVVEHDPDVIKIADHVIDMGPNAGSQGGNVMYEGDFLNLAKADTLTAKALRRPVSINEEPRKFSETFTTSLSSKNNLKNISVSIPKGVFTVVTGVAGSGKSTLIHQVFAKEYPNAIVLDQSAVGANVRSNPATYTGIMDLVRSEFAEETGQAIGMFSFNSEGKCEVCNGLGYIETELAFMDAIKNECEACNGTRYKKEALDIKLRGVNISDVMKMTVSEALQFFDKKEIKNKLINIAEVGLGYLTLGQPLSTLSGGECQRIKLAKELSKKSNIYIMDEPTTGLHFTDIDVIVGIINKLVKKGNTVVTIEHNLDIIRMADWIIDIGPEAGKRGGTIIFEGTPHDLQQCKESITGTYI